MDLDRLPHFGITASEPSAVHGGRATPEVQSRAPSGLARRNSSRGGVLAFPHVEGAAPPSYIEEVNDLKAVVIKRLKG